MLGVVHDLGIRHRRELTNDVARQLRPFDRRARVAEPVGEVA